MRGNDWRQALPAVPPAYFTPTLGVTVVVSYFEAPRKLDLVLAGLERQTYPRDLFEVVVVDDGSDPPLDRPDTPLNLRVVRQDKCGFGLARARNRGVAAARHGIVVFLDGDVVAEPRLLAAHARWHHGVSDALTLGFRRFAVADALDGDDVRTWRGDLRDLFEPLRTPDPPWREKLLARTDDLTAPADDVFNAIIGCNFGVSKAFYEAAGGSDASFCRWGLEDTEFAYRAHNLGGLLVPVREANVWHLGPFEQDRGHKQANYDAQRDKVAHLIPVRRFRRSSRGRFFRVPRHVVTVAAGVAPRETVAATVETLLADDDTDLVVRLRLDAARGAEFRDRFGPEPRVRLAPTRSALDEFPASPFHVTLRPGPLPPRLLGLLQARLIRLSTAAAADWMLADGRVVRIAHAWALHRARRAGGDVADFGDVEAFCADTAAAALAQTAAGHVLGPGVKLLAVAAAVRGPRSAWAFVRWAWAGVAIRARRVGRPVRRGVRRLRVRRRNTGSRARAAAARRARTSMPVAVAAPGPRASAVFAASPGPRRRRLSSADVALLDTPGATPPGVPNASLAASPRLAVPAFDPAVHNPMGWRTTPERWTASLGSPRRLPAGIRADRGVPLRRRHTLQRCHHVVDAGTLHANAVARAGALARLTASGVPVHLADHDPALEELLGAGLYALLAAGVPDDPARRESHSIRARRIALREHTLAARARALCAAADHAPPPLPTVSVLVATRRPALLARAVRSVAKQDYPALELVLGLHGRGFDGDMVDRAAGGCRAPVRVVRVGAARPLGAVLNAAAAAATGSLVTKMDDDDLYDAHHVWDLVLAHQYSGAMLVGKGIEYVYLADSDETIRRNQGYAETHNAYLAGGTLLIARCDLERLGGWRPLSLGEDLALIADVAAARGGVYRTHGAGFVLVRHRRSNTWRFDHAAWRADAETVWPGWAPSPAGINDEPPLRR